MEALASGLPRLYTLRGKKKNTSRPRADDALRIREVPVDILRQCVRAAAQAAVVLLVALLAAELRDREQAVHARDVHLAHLDRVVALGLALARERAITEAHLERTGGAEAQIREAQVIARRNAGFEDEVAAVRRLPIDMDQLPGRSALVEALEEEVVGRVDAERALRPLHRAALAGAGHGRVQEAPVQLLVHVDADARVAEQGAEVLALVAREAQGARRVVKALEVPVAVAVGARARHVRLALVEAEVVRDLRVAAHDVVPRAVPALVLGVTQVDAVRLLGDLVLGLRVVEVVRDRGRLGTAHELRPGRLAARVLAVDDHEAVLAEVEVLARDLERVRLRVRVQHKGLADVRARRHVQLARALPVRLALLLEAHGVRARGEVVHHGELEDDLRVGALVRRLEVAEVGERRAVAGGPALAGAQDPGPGVLERGPGHAGALDAERRLLADRRRVRAGVREDAVRLDRVERVDRLELQERTVLAGQGHARVVHVGADGVVAVLP